MGSRLYALSFYGDLIRYLPWENIFPKCCLDINTCPYTIFNDELMNLLCLPSFILLHCFSYLLIYSKYSWHSIMLWALKFIIINSIKLWPYRKDLLVLVELKLIYLLLMALILCFSRKMKDLLYPAYTNYDCENLMHLYPHNVSPFCRNCKAFIVPISRKDVWRERGRWSWICTKKISLPNVMDIPSHNI